MKVRKGIAAAAGLVALAAGALGITNIKASAPVTNTMTWAYTVSGDTWQLIAVQLDPAASSTDQTAYAHRLDRENSLTSGTDSITAALPVDYRFHYEAAEFPPASTTTTAAATTTTAPPAAIVQVSQTLAHGAPGVTATTSSIACPSGDIAVWRVAEDADASHNQNATLGNSGTLLPINAVALSNTTGANGAFAAMYWSPCDGVSHTFSAAATSSPSKPTELVITVFSGVNLTTPFPAASSKVGNVATASPLNVTYPSTALGSLGLLIGMDWNNAGSPSTPSTSTDTGTPFVVTGPGNDGIAVKDSVFSTSVGQTMTLNVSGAGHSETYVAAEMVPASGGGGGTTTTTAATTTTLAATTTTAAATTTTVAPSGMFHTLSTQAAIVDPHGVAFQPKGVNCGVDQAGTYPPSGAYTQGGACYIDEPGHVENHAPDALAVGFNIVRLNMSYGDSQSRDQSMINAYTAAHIAVILDCHEDVDGSGDPNGAAWLASGCPTLLGPLLDANKTNTYVWIEPANEENHGTDATTWANFHSTVNTWVRTTHSAPNTMIVADMMNYGQAPDLAATYQSWLTSNGITNTVLAWHNYGSVSTGSATDAQRTTAANLLMADHVPTMIQEFGYNIDGVDRGTATADDTAGFNWTVAHWTDYPFGGVYWHGTGAADARDLKQCSPPVGVGGAGCAWYTTGLANSTQGAAFFPLSSSAV